MKSKDQLKEYQKMSLAALLKKETDLKKKIFDLKMKLSVGKIKNTAQLNLIRKDLARVKTLIFQLAAQDAVKLKEIKEQTSKKVNK
ncbi:MAG: 50S ribosomal protein L29 [Patescibacteria group bacterium]|nr:50S ribosomal protein L29 [Patescibacteria group bacterium]